MSLIDLGTLYREDVIALTHRIADTFEIVTDEERYMMCSRKYCFSNMQIYGAERDRWRNGRTGY